MRQMMGRSSVVWQEYQHHEPQEAGLLKNLAFQLLQFSAPYCVAADVISVLQQRSELRVLQLNSCVRRHVKM